MPEPSGGGSGMVVVGFLMLLAFVGFLYKEQLQEKLGMGGGGGARNSRYRGTAERFKGRPTSGHHDPVRRSVRLLSDAEGPLTSAELMTSAPAASQLRLPNADVSLIQNALGPAWADDAHERLMSGVSWSTASIQMFGRHIPSPRLTAWVGDHAYTYSSLTWPPAPWSSTRLRPALAHPRWGRHVPRRPR